MRRSKSTMESLPLSWWEAALMRSAWVIVGEVSSLVTAKERAASQEFFMNPPEEKEEKIARGNVRGGEKQRFIKVKE